MFAGGEKLRRRKSWKEAELEKEKLREMWMKGCDKIMHRSYDTLSMDNLAHKFVGKFLENLLEKIGIELKKANKDKATVENSQKAIEAVLPPQLFKYAASEGQKEVFIVQTINNEFLERMRRKFSRPDSQMEELMRRTTREALSRNIVRGMEKVLEKIMPGAKFDKHGYKVTSHFIISLTDKLVEKLRDKDYKNVTLLSLQELLTEYFPKSVASHAKSEGQKWLYEYESNVFDWIPQIPVTTISEQLAAARARGEETTQSQIIRLQNQKMEEFESGVRPMVAVIHPDGYVPPKAKKFLLVDLEKLHSMIVSDLANQQGKKKFAMIQEFVDKYFPGLMAEHANAEGLKMIHRHETKEFEFDKLIKPTSDELMLTTAKEKEAQDSFHAGITSIGKDLLPKTTLHKSAVTVIAKELNSLYELIIDRQKDSDVYISPHDLHRVANEILPLLLFEHAVAEGEKMVSLYEMKGFQFSPPAMARKKKKEVGGKKRKKVGKGVGKKAKMDGEAGVKGKKRKAKADGKGARKGKKKFLRRVKKKGLEGEEEDGVKTKAKKGPPKLGLIFGSGNYKRILSFVDSEIDTQVGKGLDDFLTRLGHRIITEAKKGSKSKIEVLDVSNSLKKVFTPGFRHHANAEGMKAITKFESGLIEFDG